MSEIIEENGDSRKLSESSDNENDFNFKPVVTLPEVIIPTHEEDEEELVKIRGRFYRFAAEADPPEWKERGTGDLKFLRHKEKNSIRIVMRRDKTLKVCANHFITPTIELKPHGDTQKAFVYTVIDFADEVAKAQCMAIKFSSVENAQLFETKFHQAKKIVMTECDLYNGKAELEDSDESESSDDDSQNSEEIAKKMQDLNVSKQEVDAKSE